MTHWNLLPNSSMHMLNIKWQSTVRNSPLYKLSGVLHLLHEGPFNFSVSYKEPFN